MTPKGQSLSSVSIKRQQLHKVLLNELEQLDKQLVELETKTRLHKPLEFKAE